MTELFLAIITLLACKTNDSDRPVALVYLMMSQVAYWSHYVVPEALMFHFMATCEAILVISLVSLRGCSISRITDLMIPVAFAAVCLDVYGWYLVVKEQNIDGFNNIVILYYAVITLIFLYAVGRYDRDNAGHSRFLRDHMGNNPLLGKAS